MQRARDQHPSVSSWRPDLRRMTERMAQQLEGEGARWPTLGAEVVAARARVQLPAGAFATLLGIDCSSLWALEAGDECPSPALEQLSRFFPDIEWGRMVSAPVSPTGGTDAEEVTR